MLQHRLTVQLVFKQIQVSVIYVGVQLGLFKHLGEDASSPVSVAQLAERSGASPELLRTSSSALSVFVAF